MDEEAKKFFQQEKQKKMVLWGAVAIIMLGIIYVWTSNLIGTSDSTYFSFTEEKVDKQNNLDLSQVTNNFNDLLNRIENELSQLKPATTTEATATSTKNPEISNLIPQINSQIIFSEKKATNTKIIK